MSSAGAAPSFVVDADGDQSDASPGDGICATAGGACTLRAALEEANAGSGGQNITFAADATITLGSALPTITAAAGGVTIAGGDHAVVISGAGVVRPFRVAPDAGLTLQNLTVSNGLAIGAGGAIFNDGGNVVLNGVVLRDNEVVRPPLEATFNEGTTPHPQGPPVTLSVSVANVDPDYTVTYHWSCFFLDGLRGDTVCREVDNISIPMSASDTLTTVFNGIQRGRYVFTIVVTNGPRSVTVIGDVTIDPPPTPPSP